MKEFSIAICLLVIPFLVVVFSVKSKELKTKILSVIYGILFLSSVAIIVLGNNFDIHVLKPILIVLIIICAMIMTFDDSIKIPKWLFLLVGSVTLFLGFVFLIH